MSDPVSILPPNRTPVEVALERAIRVADPDLSPVARLMNPATCPADLLGWLAWSFSVDVWDPAWTEDRKRAVLAQSIDIHRVKGTRGAVRRALAVVGFEFTISEWFEHGGAPHTFRIDAFGQDIFDAGFAIDQELVDRITAIIDNVKPVRAHFTLRVGEARGASIAVRTGSAQVYQSCQTHQLQPGRTVHRISTAVRTGSRIQCVDHNCHRFEMRGAA